MLAQNSTIHEPRSRSSERFWSQRLCLCAARTGLRSGKVCLGGAQPTGRRPSPVQLWVARRCSPCSRLLHKIYIFHCLWFQDPVIASLNNSKPGRIRVAVKYDRADELISLSCRVVATLRQHQKMSTAARKDLMVMRAWIGESDKYHERFWPR